MLNVRNIIKMSQTPITDVTPNEKEIVGIPIKDNYEEEMVKLKKSLIHEEENSPKEVECLVSGKTYIKKLGKISYTNLGFEDHGILTFMLGIDLEGSHQGFGGYKLRYKYYGLDVIEGILQAIGVDKWEDLKNKNCWAIYNNPYQWNDKIVGVQGFKNKLTFLIEELDLEREDVDDGL
jgi:hypothetical protein